MLWASFWEADIPKNKKPLELIKALHMNSLTRQRIPQLVLEEGCCNYIFE